MSPKWLTGEEEEEDCGEIEGRSKRGGKKDDEGRGKGWRGRKEVKRRGRTEEMGKVKRGSLGEAKR